MISHYFSRRFPGEYKFEDNLQFNGRYSSSKHSSSKKSVTLCALLALSTNSISFRLKQEASDTVLYGNQVKIENLVPESLQPNDDIEKEDDDGDGPLTGLVSSQIFFSFTNCAHLSDGLC